MAITPVRAKWRSSMTDRERFNRQMHHQSVDRCFNMEFGYWDELFGEWEVFVNNGIKSNKQADILFNFDRMGHLGGKWFLYPAFEEKVVGERGRNLLVTNADGLLAEIPKDRHDTIPHYIESPVKTPEDWKRVKEERFNPNTPGRLPDVEACKERHPAGRDYPLGIDCGSMIGRIRDILTFEGLCYAVYDYPDMVEDMVETVCVLIERQLDHLLPHFEFDFAYGWEDICYKNGPIVSPDFFRQVLAPRYKRINNRLKAHGIDIWYTDCDGDVRPILPILLDCGVNCLFPFEVNCCSHPGELLDQYGGELRIMGGVDKMALLDGREAIRDYLESVAPWVARGGYIPFCDHRCPSGVTQENYFYYLDLKEKMFGM